MGSAQEISLPIKLEVLLSSIADLLKVLNTLQPNTSGWKSLSKIIETMKSDAVKLLALISMPFSSLKLFNLTEKTIDKMEEAAARVKVVMDSLQFSDLKLTPVLLDLFKQFETEINNIRAEYAKLLDDLKLLILSTGDNATLIGSLGDAKSVLASFDTIKSAVDAHVADLSAAVDKLLDLFNQLKSNIELGMRATALTSSTGGLTREALGDSIFNKFLKETANGILFKGGNSLGRESFLRAIEEAYKLEPGQLLHLAKLTFDLMNEAFLNYGKSNANPFSNLINLGNKGVRERGKTYTELEDLKKLLKEYLELANELDILKNNKIDPTNSINTARITEVEERMKLLKQTIFETFTSGSNAASGAINSMTSLLAMFKSLLLASNAEFLRFQRALMSFNAMKMTIINFMGFNLVLLLTKRAVREAAKHIKELDTVMNKISIVTNMDTSDLWALMDQYSAMAQKYGASIKGAYEVSLIYYQQGLDTNDVMTLTNETLKLAKISGLDYAASTDYMTTALRGFKMEMTEAATVVDVYSNLAANTAVSLEELAVAMSKTASSMESVGASFQESSAMIATMVAVTRESATNIGSAMKSIASRYGEMKKAPSLTLDEDGEEIDYNKVDTALKSVGISMKTTEGQFRDFTDVIIELGEKWDQLESTQQRYIATLFAGNRLQSRFLALVSNIDLLKSNLNYAENSEDVGTLQAIKALDSLESKIEQVRVAYQQFYTTIGIESVWKGFLDGAKNVVNTLNRMPKLFGTLPVGAINAIVNVIGVIKNLALHGLLSIATIVVNTLKDTVNLQSASAQLAGTNWLENFVNSIKSKLGLVSNAGLTVGLTLNSSVTAASVLTANSSKITANHWNLWSRAVMDPTYSLNIRGKVNGLMQQYLNLDVNLMKTIVAGGLPALDLINQLKAALELEGTAAGIASSGFTAWATSHAKWGSSLTNLGYALNIISLAINTTTRGGKALSGTFLMISGAAMVAGAAITAVTNAAKVGGTVLLSMPWMAIASGVIAVVNGISQLVQSNSVEAKLEEFTARAEELGNTAKELKANYNTLNSSIKKYNELKDARYDSAEAAEEYLEAVDKIAEAFPQLIDYYNEAGEAVLNASAMEDTLAAARARAAEATLRAALAEADKVKALKAADKKKLYESNNAFEKTWDALGKYIDIKTGETLRVGDVNSSYHDLVSDAIRTIYWAIEREEPNLDAIFEGYSQLNTILELAGWTLTDSWQKELDKIVDAAILYLSDNDIIDTANRTTVSAYINKEFGATKAGSILSGNTNLLSLASLALYDLMKADGIENFSISAMGSYAHLMFSAVEETWGSLTDNLLEKINTILSNPDDYTTTDLLKLAEEYGIQVDEWMITLFGNKTKSNVESILNKVGIMLENKLDEESAKKITDSVKFALVTLSERNLLTSGLNQVSLLLRNGQSYTGFLDNFLSVYNSITQVPAAARNALITEFTKNGFTKEGLLKTLNYIKEEEIKGVDIKSIKAIIDDIIPNIMLEIETTMATLTDNLDDIESITSNVQSGIKGSKLEKTIAEAKKLGMDFSREDFLQDGDKFIIDYKRLQEELDKLDTQYKLQFVGMKERLNSTMDTLGESGFTDIDSARLILGGQFEDYYEGIDIKDKNGNVIGKNWRLKSQYQKGKELHAEFTAKVAQAKKEADDAIDNYYNYLDALNAQLLKTAAWKHGDYSSLSTLGLDEKLYGTKEASTAYDRIKYLAAHPEKLTPKEYALPDVTNAIENYRKGISSMLDDLSNYGVEYVSTHAWAYEGLDETKLQQELSTIDTSNGKTLITAIKEYANEAKKTIDETNTLIITAIEQLAGIGLKKGIAELVSGNKFTASDLSQYLNKYKKTDEEKDITKYIDGNDELIDEGLKSIYQLDKATGEFKLVEEATLEAVLDAWANVLDVDKIEEGTELYRLILSLWVSDHISKADTNDSIKQSLTLLSNLSKAKIGDRIDVHNLTSKFLKALTNLGLAITNGYIEVTSEYALNNAIAALETLLNDSDLKPTEKINLISIVNEAKSKLSKSGALEDIILETVSLTAADAWTLASGSTDTAAAMTNLGYTWNAALKSYVAGADSAEKIQAEITRLEEEGSTDPAVIKQLNDLKTKLATFKKSLASKNVSALKDILTNTESVSDEMITALADSLKKPREEMMKYFLSRGDGTYTTDLTGFIADIESGLLTVSETAANLLADTVQETITGFLAGLESEVESATKVGKYSEIRGLASKIWLEMSKEERELIGSIENLYTRDAEQGGWTLTKAGRDFLISHEKNLVIDEYIQQAAFYKKIAAYLDLWDDIIEDPLDIINGLIRRGDLTEDERSAAEGYAKTWKRGTSAVDAIAIINEQLQKNIDLTESDYANIMVDKLADFDFAAIVAGTANKEVSISHLLTLLKLAGVDPSKITDEAMEGIYQGIANNDWNTWNALFEEGSKYSAEKLIGQTKIKEFAKSNYDQYNTAFEEAIKNTNKDSWSKATQALYEELGATSTEEFTTLLDNKLIESVYDTFDTLKSRREELLKLFLAETAFVELTKSGAFKEDDLTTYILTYLKESATEYYDFAKHEFIDKGKDLAKYWNFDELTGEIESLTKDSEEGFGNALVESATLLGTSFNKTTSKARNIIKDVVDGHISDLNKADIDLTASELIRSITSETGKWQSISDLPEEVKTSLRELNDGVEVSNDAIYISSEAGLQSVINTLDKSKSAFDITKYRQSIEEIETAKSEFDTKYDLGANVEKLLSGSVDKETARIIAFIKGQGESQDAINTYMESLGYKYSTRTGYYEHLGKEFDGLTGLVDEVTEKYEDTKFVNNILNSFENMQIAANLMHQLYTALDTLITNREAVTYDQITELATSLGEGVHPEDIIDLWFSEGIAPDTYKFNLNQFKASMKTGQFTDWQPEVLDKLAPRIASIRDDIISSISDAASATFEGVDKKEAIEQLSQEFKDLTGEDMEYIWDPLTSSYKMTLESLNKYKKARIEELKQQGLWDKNAEAEIQAKTLRVAALAVDISSFISADNRGEESQAYEKFKEQLKNYYDLIGEAVNLKEKIAMFDKGGKDAVDEALKIATAAGLGELSDDDILAIYAPAIDRLVKYRDALANLTVGSYVASADLRLILTDAGVDMIDANGLVSSVENLADAYLAIYNKMVDIADGAAATLQLKNETYAKYLNTSEQKEVDAIDTLGKAMGMTYDEFATLLTNNGKELKTVLEQLTGYGIELLGNGKIRISDFTKFASLMGWSPQSEEYTSAFKSYNDALIERNKLVKELAYEEVSLLKDIKPGEWLNLTYTTKEIKKFSKKLAKDTVRKLRYSGELTGDDLTLAVQNAENEYFKSFGEKLAKAGAILDNGILQLTEDANLLGVAQVLQNAALDMGTEMSDELADMVLSIMQSYTEAINKGIEGGLTNVEKTDLVNKAADLGITELDFTETAEGLQLSQKSAIELYRTVSQIDRLQSKSIFTTLSKQLEESNSEYKTTTKLLAHIADLEELIKKASDERKKVLEEELAVAKEINAQRLIQSDADWNFMNNNALPGSFTNAIEYWQGWANASKTLNEAAQKLRIDPSALATMFLHVYELAEATGQPRTFMGLSTANQSMSELLDMMGSIVTIDAKTGEAVLTAEKLKSIGINLSLGMKGISDGVKDAAKEYAQMNANLIKKIHTFYSNLLNIREALDDKDLNWDDFFEGGKFNYDKFITTLGNESKAVKAFSEFADTVSINGKHLSELVKDKSITAQTSHMMLSIFTMMYSDDWDTETGYLTIAEHLASSGFNGELDLGDMLFSVRGKHVLSKAAKDNKWTDSVTGKTYDTATKAYEAINKRELDELTSNLSKYGTGGKTDKGYDIEVDGKPYTFTVNTDGKIQYQDKSGTHTYNDISEFYDEQYQKYSKEAGEQALSRPGWDVKQKVSDLSVFKSGSTLTSLEREKIRKFGLEKLENWLETWDNFLSEYGDDAAFELEALLGIKFNLDKDNKINPNDILALLDEAKVDEMAASVQAGITNAFKDEGVAGAISSAIGQAFVGDNGVPIPEIKLNPENVGLAEGSSDKLLTAVTAAAKDLKADILGNTAPLKADVAAVTFPELTVNVRGKYTGTDGLPDGADDSSSINKGFKKPGLSLNNNNNNSNTRTVIATGNIGLALAKGTLMGELGPELVVSDGRYFVVGQSGPEMVDLAADAIVFNHLQTESLLTKGTSSGRGRAITNERTAAAYALGSRHGGIAKDSLSVAAQLTSGAEPAWGSGFDILNNTDSTKDKDKDNLKAYVKEFERWYNWLQKIAHLEKEISLEEAKRTRYASDFIRSGADFYKSQIKTLDYLKQLLAIQRDLNEKRKEYNKGLREQLNNSPFSIMYEFDENFLPVYKEGMYDFVSQLLGQDFTTNAANNNVKAIYDLLNNMGFGAMMEYDKSGNKIDTSKEGWEATAVQTIIEMMEKRNQEGLTAHDEEIEGDLKEEELLNSENEILKEIEDNQIAVENKVLKAIEDSRERAIEDSKKERDAIEKANLKLIDGLNKLLENERTMRLNLKDADELSTLQRRLAILQRSGGSASEIASLQLEITDKQYDKYFETQEQLIKAIEDASTAELERLDNQISIMEETLEYEKLHGLLWEQVYDVLQGSPEDIAAFILENDSSYWNKSVAELQLTMREDIFSIDKYKALISDAPSGDINELRTKVIGYIEDLLKEETSTEGNGEVGNNQGTGGSGENSNETEKTNSPPNNLKKSKYGVTVNGETTYFDTKKEAEEFRDNAIGSYELIARNANANLSKKELDKAVKDYLAQQDIKLIELSAEKIEEITQNQKVAAEEAKIKEANATVLTAKTNLNLALSNFKNATTDAAMLAAAQAIAAALTQLANANKLIISSNETIKEIKKKKASGGYVNHGLYELGELGTETVLTASQTKVLRDNILSNRPDSLVNLLKSYNEAYHGLSSTAYDSISNVSDNSVTIERAEVNLQIDELANDYDARRAANTVMDELLQIARKTSASNRVGRR